MLLVKDGASQSPKTLNQVLAQGATVDAVLRDSSGSVIGPVTVNSSGGFNVEGLQPGTYSLTFRFRAPDGTLMAGTKITVTVTQEGELALETGLIDPYGIVSDSVTGQPIEGVTMKLWWADTPLNRQMGRTPDTLVQLPILVGFPPADNAVPHDTNADGEYAWMVFADGDYYITAEREGYHPFDSRKDTRRVDLGDSWIRDGIIHVGETIVEYDLQMEPKGTTGAHHRYIQGYPDGTFGPERAITRAEVATILVRITGTVGPNDTAQLHPDVNPAHWAARNIQAARARGLMIGDPDGNFRPDEPISRAEVAVIALRFKSLEPQLGSAFDDAVGHWGESFI